MKFLAREFHLLQKRAKTSVKDESCTDLCQALLSQGILINIKIEETCMDQRLFSG